jgi:choline kinase
MKNLYAGHFNEVLITKTVRVLPYAHINETPVVIHDSVNIFTTEVKNHGDGLLIVLQEATSTRANLGTTLFTIKAHVVLLPFGDTPTDLQAHCSYSYTMSP